MVPGRNLYGRCVLWKIEENTGCLHGPKTTFRPLEMLHLCEGTSPFSNTAGMNPGTRQGFSTALPFKLQYAFHLAEYPEIGVNKLVLKEKLIFFI